MFLRSLLVDDNDGFLEAASVFLEREGTTVVGVASNTAGRPARHGRTSFSSISGWGTRAASTSPAS
jgi:DNA-binding NarL/FixJ family response regulator